MRIKEDLVFVGGFAMYLQGIKQSFNDYDVVVISLDGLHDAITYKTDSKFSKSGNRAFITGKRNIDIFIENKLPEYEIIKGVKVATKKAMSEYYSELIPNVSAHWKAIIEQKLKLLKWHKT